MDRRPTDVAETVRAAVSSIGATDDEAIVIDVADDVPLVDADPALLERTVANLVANAVRSSPAPGTVLIDAQVVGPAVLLRIVDRGPGIAPEDHARVLAPFQRLGDRPNGEGVGLGLSIAQGFVEAIGATMTFDTTPGGGLTVTLALPLVAVPVRRGPQERSRVMSVGWSTCRSAASVQRSSRGLRGRGTQ